MRGLNQVQLIGNLGADPEVRYTQGGMRVGNLRIATNYTRTNKDTGEKSEHAEWHRVTVFDKLAEIVEKHLHKGSPVFVQGRLRTRKWERDGVTHYTTEIVVDSLIMLPDGNGNGNGASQAASAQAPAAPDIADDIPF